MDIYIYIYQLDVISLFSLLKTEFTSISFLPPSRRHFVSLSPVADRGEEVRGKGGG